MKGKSNNQNPRRSGCAAPHTNPKEMNMKIQILRVTLMLTLLSALGVATASAGSTDKIKVSIPFAFTVGNATLPAGDYDIEHRASYGGIIFVHNADGRGAAAHLTNQVKRPSRQTASMLL